MTGDLPDRLVALSDDEALALIATAAIGRIAYVADGEITVTPLNFCLIGHDIYVRTAQTARLLTAARRLSPAAFETDGVAEWSQTGWSALIRGALSEVTDVSTVEAVSQHLLPWVGSGDFVVRLTAERMTARSVVGGPGGVHVNAAPPRRS